MQIEYLKKQTLALVMGVMLSFFLMPTHANAAQSVRPLFHHTNDPVAGNPKGTVTVVEFFDYECAHCLTMAGTVEAIIRNNPHVRFVFKETPLNGPLAETATRAALAAQKQGKYFTFSHALMRSGGRLTKDRVLNIAKSVGLDVKKLEKDMYDRSVTNEIQGNYQLWRSYGLRGTPSFFIGKSDEASLNNVKYVMGEMSQRELQSAINSAR